MDKPIVARELSQAEIDLICQEQIDLIEGEGLDPSPERLEKWLAHRIASMSERDLKELKAKSKSRRLSRSITRSVERAASRMRGSAGERFRKGR